MTAPADAAASPAAPAPLSLPQAATEAATPLHVARVSMSDLGI